MGEVAYAHAGRALRGDPAGRRVALLGGLLVVAVATAALFGGLIELLLLVDKGDREVVPLLVFSLVASYAALALATTAVHAAVTILLGEPPSERSVRAAFAGALRVLPRLAPWTMFAATLGLVLHLAAVLARGLRLPGPAFVLRWPGVSARVVPDVLAGRGALEALREAWADARVSDRAPFSPLAVALPALPLLAGALCAWMGLAARGGPGAEAIGTLAVVLLLVLVSGVAPFLHGHAQATIAARRALDAAEGAGRATAPTP